MRHLRNPATVLKNLSEKACNKGYRFQRLYRNLYNLEFYLLAYNNIYATEGSMTAGADGKTLDDMSIGRIEEIILSIKNHSYQPNPAKRVYIEKKNSAKKRPLGIPSTDDKLVQEIVRMILESIYETEFSSNSHGFRPNKSCHTGLKQIKNTFTGAKWFIEGDIKACFDSFDHHILTSLLRKRIDDEYFISLMWKFLKAGYMEQWEYYTTYSGTPQGSGISPILANIYLNELDKYMEEYKTKFDEGDSKHRKVNPEYKAAHHICKKTRRKYADNWLNMSKNEKGEAIQEVKELRKRYLNMNYLQPIDRGYKALHYCRYADDWLVSVIGSKEDAERIKSDIKQFLSQKLNLEMSEVKTKITHATDKARFLGYDITVDKGKGCKRTKKGVTQRIWSSKIKLYIPKEKWVQKLREYHAFTIRKDSNGMEKWIPTARGKLMNYEDINIISKYNAEIRGLYNYYSIANNVSVLNCFSYIMKYSMYKTFAAKYRTNKTKIIEKYSQNGEFGVAYKTKSGEKRCIFYNKGFKRKEIPEKEYMDILPQYRKYEKPNSLASRIKKGVCEYCGSKTRDTRIHQVKKLKELKGEKNWEKLMIEMRRKTLALCPDCHKKLHEGSL